MNTCSLRCDLDEYLYFSSYSETMLEHSRKNVERLIQTYSLTQADLFVEIARYLGINGILHKNIEKTGNELSALGLRLPGNN